MEIRNLGLRSFILGVILLTGCCSIGFSTSLDSQDMKEETELSANDSIVLEIISIVSKGKDIHQELRKSIETRFSVFPHKIIRRDTVRYFLETVEEIAFNEFVTEDYTRCEKLSNEFYENVMESNFLQIPVKYWYVKFTPYRINEKLDVSNENFSDFSLVDRDFFKNEDIKKFFSNFFGDIPLNLSLNTYNKILLIFREAGGFPKLLVDNLTENFFEKCKKEKREDILNLVGAMWEIEGDVVEYVNNNEELDYSSLQPPSELNPLIDNTVSIDKIEKENERKFKELALELYDENGNLSMIDSLISIGEPDSIGKYIINFQNLNIIKGENRRVIEKSKLYEKYIPERWRARFYGYWGIAHLSLCEYEDAKTLFIKSFEAKENKEIFSGSVLNYATALAEQGEVEKAIELFITQQDKAKTIKEQFDYWDGLGYIFSFIDSDEAMKCYEKADSVLTAHNGDDFNANFFLTWSPNNCTRHFCRECKVIQKDLYSWKLALKFAGISAGENSIFNFYGSLPKGLYKAEAGRLKNLLFDFEGASNDFEGAKKIFEHLDSADYRIKNFNAAWQDIQTFNETYSSDPGLTVEILNQDKFSSLHKIWLILNLISQYDSICDDLPFDISFFNQHLSINYAETLLALSNYESRFLPLGIYKMQEILMTDKNLKDEKIELANLNLLRKGLLQTSKIELEKNLLKSNGKIKQDYSYLMNLRRSLNHAYAYEDSLKIRKLLPLITEKESNLYHSLKDSIKLEEFLMTDVNSIKSNLGDKDVAVDFIEYPKNGHKHLGAFIISPYEEIRFVDLLTTEDKNFNDKLWEKLLPYLKDKEDIYFSPDGSLINKGIEFYPDEDGDPLFSKYRLHRVSHLRNIKNRIDSVSGEIAIVGVSDHNSPIGEGENLYKEEWTDLKDVEYEVKLIDKLLNQYPHQLLFNDDAIEENIKGLDGKDISVIHFSTHGVYRNLDSLTYAASNKNHFDHNIAVRTLKGDRQEISGLILRKGNITWQLPHLLDDEDDILTAEEIEVMNFPNLQLTVLSACESGLGELDSDGIQGLQRAFRIAGSKNIICSLNKVDAYWSAEFMGQFYKNLANGNSIYDSFRNAQMNIKLAAPNNPVAWSSYILIE